MRVDIYTMTLVMHAAITNTVYMHRVCKCIRYGHEQKFYRIWLYAHSASRIAASVVVITNCIDSRQHGVFPRYYI